jgi:hypothetical protein
MGQLSCRAAGRAQAYTSPVRTPQVAAYGTAR